MAEKIMKPGVWLRRGDKLAVAVQFDPHAAYCQWRGSDGRSRYDDGRFYLNRDSVWDLVEWLDVPDKPVQPPQPEPDAAEDLAAVKDDRDQWRTRKVMIDGRAMTLRSRLRATQD